MTKYFSAAIIPLAAIAAALGFSPVLAQQAELQSLAVFPPTISLNSSSDRQSVVVQATYADGKVNVHRVAGPAAKEAAERIGKG